MNLKFIKNKCVPWLPLENKITKQRVNKNMFINLKLKVLVKTNYFQFTSNIYPQVNSNAEAQKDNLERIQSFFESLRAETIKRSDDFIEPTPIVEEKKKKINCSKNQIK
jgi:hypothetical protein